MKYTTAAIVFVLFLVGVDQLRQWLMPSWSIKTETLSLDRWRCTDNRREMVSTIPGKPAIKTEKDVCHQWTRND